MTVDAVTSRASKTMAGEAATAQEQLATTMVAQAQEQGLAFTGPDGLGKQLTKTVLEAALNLEMTEHVGHAKQHLSRRQSGPHHSRRSTGSSTKP